MAHPPCDIKRNASGNGTRRGFTLIELLVVVTIIVMLLGLVMAALGVVQRRARMEQARNTITRLHLGLETLILELGVPKTPALGNDGSGYLDLDPVVDAGSTYPSVLTRLVDRKLFSYKGSGETDDQRRLVDVWRQPLLFVVGQASDPNGHKPADVATGRDRWVPVNDGADADNRVYVYSYGPENPDGTDTDNWVVQENDP